MVSYPLSATVLLEGQLSHSSFQVYIEKNELIAGQTNWLAVKLEPKAGWHTYWKNPGDSGAAPYFTWDTPDNLVVGAALYAPPEPLPVGPLMNYGYHAGSTLLFPLAMGPAYVGSDITIKVEAEWLVCDIECVPQFDTWELHFPIKTDGSSLDNSSIFSDARAQLPEPSYWDSNLTISNNNSELLVFADKLDLEKIEDAYFFPEEDGVLDYSAAQQWAWNGFGLKLTFTRPSGMMAPQASHGLLKLNFEDGTTQSYELEPNQTLNVRENTPAPVQLTMPIWQAAIFALIGGLILNLMPCVFPVLSLKAFALISANYKSQRSRRNEGWAYTLGIWVSFMVIVGVLVALKAGGAAIGWGFQLQEPLFIGFLILLMVLVSLSLAGVFYLNTGAEGAGQSFTLKEGVSGSFAKGVLATLVATPCTAPFMAPAIGYALMQPILVILFIFSMLAFGLAFPFLALSYSDTLARLMPKPGAWMEKVKQGLAFPMLLTAAWLLYVYDLQAGSQAALFIVISAIIMSFGVWLYQQTAHVVGRGLAIIALICAVFLAVSVSKTMPNSDDTATEGEQLNYSQTTLDEELSAGRAVFAYFTAEWCITCKVNEQVALFTDEVQTFMAKNDIKVMKGDWTNRNAEIAQILSKHGRAGVPLYLYFPAGSKTPKVLPEILTKDIVIEYLTNNS